MPRISSTLLALLGLLALAFALGACIGPGLEPPEGQTNSPRTSADDDAAGDASVPPGNFGNAGDGTSAGADRPTHDPDGSESGPTTDPGVPVGEPTDEEDADAGVDPADSP